MGLLQEQWDHKVSLMENNILYRPFHSKIKYLYLFKVLIIQLKFIIGGPQGAAGMQGMPPGAGGGGPNQQGGNFFGGNGPPMGAPSGGAMGST